REVICPVDRPDGTTGQSVVYRIEASTGDATSFFVGAQRTNQPLETFGRSLTGEIGPFDLVHVHDWLVAFAGVALKQAHKVPLLATIHATEYGRCRGFVVSELSQAINNVEWWLTYE